MALLHGQKIYSKCDTCKGTGKLYYRANFAYPMSDPTPEDLENEEGVTSAPCTECNGAGITFFGWLKAGKEDMPIEEEE